MCRSLSAGRMPRCVRCGGTRRAIVARGLDSACWMAAKKAGALHEYPLTRRTVLDVLDEYEHLTGLGESESRVAARLGYVNLRGLRRAVDTARERRAA